MSSIPRLKSVTNSPIASAVTSDTEGSPPSPTTTYSTAPTNTSNGGADGGTPRPTVKRYGSPSYGGLSPTGGTRLPQPSSNLSKDGGSPNPNGVGMAFPSESAQQPGHRRAVSNAPAGGYARPTSTASASSASASGGKPRTSLADDSTPSRRASGANRFGFFGSPKPNATAQQGPTPAAPEGTAASRDAGSPVRQLPQTPAEKPQDPTPQVAPGTRPNRPSRPPPPQLTAPNGVATTNGGDRRVSSDTFATHRSSGSEAFADLQKPRWTPDKRSELVDLLADLVGGPGNLSEWVDIEALKASEDPPVPAMADSVYGSEGKSKGAFGDRRESAQWFAGGILPEAHAQEKTSASPPEMERPSTGTTVATTATSDDRKKMGRSVSLSSASKKSQKRSGSSGGEEGHHAKGIFGKFGWRSGSGGGGGGGAGGAAGDRSTTGGGKPNKLQKSSPGRSVSGKSSVGSAKAFGKDGSDDAMTPNKSGSVIVGGGSYGQQGLGASAGGTAMHVFGTPLKDLSRYASCVTIIGGQRHVLPIVAFASVEDIYKRGMSLPGLLRIAGDLDRIDRLVTLFDSPPTYGDGYAVAAEEVHTLCGLLKRYLRSLPEPLLDTRLTAVFWHACVEPALQVASDAAFLGMPLASGAEDRSGSHSDKRRVAIAQCLLRLLPMKAFSLLVYVTAFLSQAPLFPGNKLTLESVASILGPALLASRDAGLPGLGPGATRVPNSPTTSSREGKDGSATTPGQDDPSHAAGKRASEGLLWLLKNWNEVTDGLLEDKFDVDVDKLRSPTPMPPIAMPGRFPSTDTVGQALQRGDAARHSHPLAVGTVGTDALGANEESAEVLRASDSSDAQSRPQTTPLKVASSALPPAPVRGENASRGYQATTPPMRTAPLPHSGLEDSSPFGPSALAALNGVNADTPKPARNEPAANGERRSGHPSATDPDTPVARTNRDSSLGPASKPSNLPEIYTRAPVPSEALTSPQDAFATLSGIINSRDDIIRGQAQRLSEATQERETLSHQLCDYEARLKQTEADLGASSGESNQLREEVAQLLNQLSVNEDETTKLKEAMQAEQTKAQQAAADLQKELEALREQMEERDRLASEKAARLSEELEQARRERDEHFKQVTAVKKVLGFIPEHS